MENRDFYIKLEEVVLMQKTRRGVLLHVDEEKVKLDFIFNDVLRIKVSQGGVFDASPTFAIPQDEFGDVPFTLSRSDEKLQLCSDALRVEVELNPFSIQVLRTNGEAILDPVDEWSYRFLNNAWCVRRRKKEGDVFVGLGEKTGGLNHQGRSLTQWNTDILAPAHDGSVRDDQNPDLTQVPTSNVFDPYYMSINLLYHLPGAQGGAASASFMDNGYEMKYNLSAEGEYEIQAEGGQLTEYIFAGPGIPDILKRFAALTGKMQAPPLWALGHHQCRWFRYPEKEWKALGQTYREKQIPCDGLWLDIDYMDEYRVFTWNTDDFPDITSTLNELKEQGFRAITIIDPGVKYEKGYSVYEEGAERNLFCKTEGGQTYIGEVWPGRTAFPDFVKEEARAWWGRLNAEHVQSGLAGIWNDMNEPATGAQSPYAMRFDRDGANHAHERYHNQYAMLMAMGTYEGMRTAMPNLRTFILSRAGFAGMQRYAANWTGDNCSTWEHLAMSIPMNCNLGLSGHPFVGSDIGGFCGDTQEELLVRWYQYGVFQPFMRNHNCTGNRSQYPWSFGEKAEALIKKAIELRYRLLPYIYTSFMQSAEEGCPVQKPLLYDYQDDENVMNHTTEYLFGSSLLIAPVVEQGAVKREVYLPQGSWYCYHTGVLFNGGESCLVDAPMDTIPVFVKAGAVVPEAEVVESTMRYAPCSLDLKVYLPLSDGSYHSTLFEDDGLTDGFLENRFLKTDFTVIKSGEEYVIELESAGEGFPEHQRKGFHLSFVGGEFPDRKIDFVKGQMRIRL
ncbi:glycoside hydrolase family 31 protein [Kiritimatiellaeota bacterium B1221]|nr:glycoside hydrolase family 31 protein [Kiritimatiellaeota bacterium B1221]